jgi:hypothetical protein
MNDIEESPLTITARAKYFGLTRTFPFTKKGIEDMKKVIQFLEQQYDNIMENSCNKVEGANKDE